MAYDFMADLFLYFSSGVVNPKPMGAMGVQYNKKGILAALVGKCTS